MHLILNIYVNENYLLKRVYILLIIFFFFFGRYQQIPGRTTGAANDEYIPKNSDGGRRRSFKAAWYHIHPWLEYSKLSDSVFCYACRHFSPPKASETVFDSKLGFNNWKKATYKQGGFAIHARSERHKQAMITWRDYQKAVKSNATLVNALNKEHNKQVQENRDYIKTIGEILLLTATQNIAQRGHDESAESDNKGNFMAILETVAKHDKTVQKRLTSIHNANIPAKGFRMRF